MPSFLFYPYFRIFLIYGSAALSLVLMMLMLNIITIPEIITILKLNPKSSEAQVITQVLGRMQEVTNNIMEIIAKLFSKLLNSFGMGDIDISKIKIQPSSSGVPVNPAEAVGAGGDLPTNAPTNQGSLDNLKP